MFEYLSKNVTSLGIHITLLRIHMFHGLYTALVTPFQNDRLDMESFVQLVKFQLNSGVAGLVVLGSTGEAATLSLDERAQVIAYAVELAKSYDKRVQVIVGTGTNSTHTTLEYTKQAHQLGAAGALIVCPYYNKPTEEGIYQHYKYINDNIDFPIIIYNVPSRSITNIPDEVIARLSELKNVIGLKDATADLSRPPLLKAQLKTPTKFMQFSGEDCTAVIFNLHGGVGCISVTANILPKELSKMQRLSLAGQYIEAMSMQTQFAELNKAMFIVTNPIPVKYALYKLGIIATPDMRLPLLPLARHHRPIVDAALHNLKLI